MAGIHAMTWARIVRQDHSNDNGNTKYGIVADYGINFML